MRRLAVIDPGLLTTVQDRGRPGLAHLGVPRSGAADGPSAAAANALVGNAPEAAVLETTLTGCVLRVEAAAVVAVTGATCPIFVGGVRAPWGRPFRMAPGQTLEVAPATVGLRSYIAVRGGIYVDPVVGSRSTDTLSGLGPAALAAGDRLAWGVAQEPDAQLFATPALAPDLLDGVALLDCEPGPRVDWLGAAGWAELTGRLWTVGGASNRVGLRLEGEALARERHGEIETEGMVLGAVQLPPSGLPVIFLADHPTTGGYPVVGVLTSAAVARAAQARPGDAIGLNG